MGGPDEGPATLTLAAVPQMARIEAILDVFAPVCTCSQPVLGRKNIISEIQNRTVRRVSWVYTIMHSHPRNREGKNRLEIGITQKYSPIGTNRDVYKRPFFETRVLMFKPLLRNPPPPLLR